MHSASPHAIYHHGGRDHPYKSSIIISSMREAVVAVASEDPVDTLPREGFNFLFVFDWQTWLTLAAMLVVLRVYQKLGKKQELQPAAGTSVHAHIQWILITLSFVYFLVTNLYSNALLSRILVKNNKYRFSNFFGLLRAIERKETRPLAFNDASWVHRMQLAVSGPYAQLRAAFQVCFEKVQADGYSSFECCCRRTRHCG